MKCMVLAVVVSLFSSSSFAADLSDYSAKELLSPCIEGDNDSRDGAVLELECEQYIRGFTTSFLIQTEGGESEGICLPPPGNRADEIRWALMRWGAAHHRELHMNAGEALLRTFRSEFACEK